MVRAKKTVRRRKRIAWSKEEIKVLRAGAGTKSLKQLARAIKRSTSGVQLKASKLGISLRQKAA
jgi:hypothetical protein